MKINKVSSSKIINQYIHVREQMPSVKTKSQKADKVELTRESKTFSTAFKEAKKSLATRTPEEMKRIQDIKKRIENNSYDIRGYEIAKKILGE
jgi:anti-sigma28 factor (negative regulator of flagellin synthesis)